MENKQIERIVPQVNNTVNIENVEEVFTEDYARDLVVQTYNAYSSFRHASLDPQWVDADSLMNGVAPIRKWLGSNMPKASYPQPIVSDQFRSMVPALEQALFPDSEDWFSIVPNAWSEITPDIGRMLTNNIKSYLDDSCEIGKPSGRREIITAVMDSLLYKLGCVHVRFDEKYKRPVVEAVNIKDIYLDPKAVSPAAEMNKSIIWRRYMTVRELKEFREDKRFDIPEDSVLYGLSQMSYATPAEASKDLSSSFLKMALNTGPTIYDRSVEDKEIEVLIYYTKKRVVWVLNRLVVIYNDKNPYGFYPFCFAPCYMLPHRHYGESIPSILESTQRLSEGLMNNFVDNLHLALNPPRVIRKMAGTENGDKWYPGLTIPVQGDTAKDAVIFQEIPTTTLAPIWDMQQWLRQESYARTGSNPLQQGGIPTPSNANRTASGMQMQTQGGSMRIYAIVKQFEDFLMIPLIKKMLTLCQVHIMGDEEVEGFNENGNAAKIKGALFHIPARIEIKCASRVISKAQLQQTLPGLMQYLTQGQLVNSLHQIGQTIDMAELSRAIMDASGLGKMYSLVRPLSQQEIQAMQQAAQPRPDPNLMAQLQAKKEEYQFKGQVDLQKAQMANQPNPAEMQMEQMKAEMEMKLKQMDLEVKRQMAEMEVQKKQMELMFKEAEMRMKIQHSGQEMQLKQQEMMANAEMNQQQRQMEMAQQHEAHEMEMEHSQASGQLSLEQQKQAGDLKMKQASQKPNKPQKGEA